MLTVWIVMLGNTATKKVSLGEKLFCSDLMSILLTDTQIIVQYIVR